MQTKMVHNTPPVAVVVILRGPDQELHYAIPPTLLGSLQPGTQVEVPLGSRSTLGYVVGFSETACDKPLREIRRILEETPALPSSLLKLAEWISRYYQVSLARAVRLLVPPDAGRGRPKRTLHIRLLRSQEETEKEIALLDQRATRMRSLLKELVKSGGEAPLNTFPLGSHTAVATLEKKGLLERFARESFRDPFPELGVSSKCLPSLSSHQESALAEITIAIEHGNFSPFLLHGVTGSGKTEVYLRAVELVLKKGKGAIVLVPEIGLTSQLLARFRERFGEQVVLFHSALSSGERFDAWRQVRKGKATVAVGARSAIFSPLHSLGLIVVDEEQDPSYKQEEGVRYHARDISLIRGQQEGAVVILGSATPSLESYQNGLNGKYSPLILPERIDARPLPKVHIVPFPKEKSPSFLTQPLLEAIQNRLAAKEQTLLFLNRRGFSPFILCRECGEVPKCVDCSVSLTLHKRAKALLCHYCGHAIPPPTECGRCHGTQLKELGMGTERMEDVLKSFFPDARILRMDRDTTQKKHSHHKILQSVSKGEIDILIGTQMIAKGHDLHRVTLVGVLCAEIGLQMPDFRAAERIFQLLVQVSGRAGRGEQPGEVFVQTYNPHHYTIRYARLHDVVGFYREELAHRKEGRYPPFCRIIALRLRGQNEDEVANTARLLAIDLKNKSMHGGKIDIFGPSPCPIERIRNAYRWQILLKGPSNRSMTTLLNQVLPFSPKKRSIRLEIDVDPQNLL